MLVALDGMSRKKNRLHLSPFNESMPNDDDILMMVMILLSTLYCIELNLVLAEHKLFMPTNWA